MIKIRGVVIDRDEIGDEMKLTHTFELRSLEESSLAKNFPINRWAAEQAPRNGSFVPDPQENIALWIAEDES